MNNPIILVVAVLLFLFFCFATYMFTKTWRWHHVTIAFFVFAAAMFYCYYASLSVKTRVAVLKEYDTQAKALERVTKEQEQIKYGDLHLIVQKEDSLRSIRHKVAREMLERGRVWRNCTPVGGLQQDGTITLNVPQTAPAAPAAAAVPGANADAAAAAAAAAGVPAGAAPAAPVAAAPAAPQPIRLDPKTVLFCFLETQLPQAVPPGNYPSVFIGEFAVTATTDTTVTVRPLMMLPTQQNGTWSLYETMPIDAHGIFAARDVEPDENHVFGVVNEQELRALLPKQQGQTDADYEAVIQSHLRDGTPATDQDPPENIWVQVKFLKEHEVQVDAEATVSALDNRPYDNTGRAVVARLQRGEPAKFKPNDFALFKQEYANDLIGQGISEKVKPIYIRKLREYEYSFHEINDRLTRLAADMERVQRNTAKLDDANKLGLQQIAYRELEVKKLQTDFKGFNAEQIAAGQLRDALLQKWNERRQMIQDFYRANRELEQELRTVSEKLREQIDRRTADAGREARS